MNPLMTEGFLLKLLHFVSQTSYLQPEYQPYNYMYSSLIATRSLHVVLLGTTFALRRAPPLEPFAGRVHLSATELMA